MLFSIVSIAFLITPQQCIYKDTYLFLAFCQYPSSSSPRCSIRLSILFRIGPTGSSGPPGVPFTCTFPHLSIPKGTLIMQTSFMWLVFHMNERRQLQNPLDMISQLLSDLMVCRTFVPNTDDIFGVSYTYNSSTNFFSGR